MYEALNYLSKDEQIIAKYTKIKTDMITFDTERDKLFESIDDMWHGNFQLPKELKDLPDMREIIDMSPHDALKSGTAILSTSMPHWQVQPLLSGEGEIDRAKKIAFAIDYAYRRMNKRGSSTILWDMVHSCLRYDAVAVWLDFLPVAKEKDLRHRHARRMGDFVAKVYNPRNVHIRSDTLGINTVLLAVNVSAKSILAKFPGRAHDLESYLDEKADNGDTRAILNDMMLYEGDKIRRVVWCQIVEGIDNTDSVGVDFVIMNEFIDTPFMPWIVRVGGSDLETRSEYSVHPLLGPLHTSHKWIDLCAFQSIMQSEIIKYGRSPRVVTNTASGDGVEIDYLNGNSVNLDLAEKAAPFAPGQIDPNLKELIDRVRAEVSATTLPRILQNPEFAGNTPFASINAMIQTALGGLNPAKRLCQGAHEEMAMKMIEWYAFAKLPMKAYSDKKSSLIEGGMNLGDNIVVPVDQLNPDTIIVDCQLFAETPTDFVQRLNSAISLNQNLKVPRSKVLAELGYEDVEALYQEYLQETYDDQEVALDIQTSQSDMQIQQQQKAMEMQMKLQEAAQQNAQNAQNGGPPMISNSPMRPPVQLPTNMPQGQGYNTNAGVKGPQPGQNTKPLGGSAGNPGVSLREQISGQDYTGAQT